MNYIDIILIIPIAIGAWKGFRKGLILEVFSLLALFAGIYAGVYFSSFAADFLREDVKLHSEYIGIGAFLVTFVAVLVGVYYLGKMVSSMAKIASLELVNKIMGSVFSSIKALLILSIALMCLKGLNGKFDVLPEELIEESRSAFLGVISFLFDRVAVAATAFGRRLRGVLGRLGTLVAEASWPFSASCVQNPSPYLEQS